MLQPKNGVSIRVMKQGIAVADSGGGRAPPFGKASKCKRAPLTENVWYYPSPTETAPAFGDHGKILLLPPPRIARACGDHGKFLLLPPPHWIATACGDHGKILLLPPPTESLRLAETTEKFYYPPPTESRRLGTSHERGPLFRKILDLRLHCTLQTAHSR